jgi:hypothetical protein
LGRGGQLRDGEPGAVAGVGGEDPGPARVADDGDATPSGQGLGPEQQRHVEQLVQRVDPDHAGLAEQRVDRDVGTGHRRGMRGGGPHARRRASALDRHDRLATRHPPSDAAELAGVAERLQVQQDDVGSGVVLPVLQQVVAADVGLVADRDEARHPQPDARRPFEHGDAQGARLRLHGDATRSRRVRREGGVQTDRGVGDADAVGADQPHPVTTCPVAHRGLYPGASRHLVEARREHHETGHALAPALLDDVEDRGRGHGDHREVDIVGNIQDRRVRPDAGHVGGAGVHRVDRAGEATGQEVTQDLVADGGRLAAGTDHCDRAWCQQPGHRAGLG